MLTRGVQAMLAYCVLAGLLSACQGSVQGQQLDINYATTTGVGSITGTAVKLPLGRYTFFTYADPPNCLQSVALLDHAGKPAADDASQRIATVPASFPPGVPTITANSLGMQMVPTFVQQELGSGSYRLKITARSSGCAWEVEQILNYMLGNEAPPKPIVPPPAPILDVRLGVISPDRHFHVDAPGIYKLDWTVTPCDQYSVDLARTGGGAIRLGDGQSMPAPPGGGIIGPQGSGGPIFLGAGDWTAQVSTRCFWQLTIAPWRGSTGGGGQGFHG
jgi:hypothetical protein